MHVCYKNMKNKQKEWHPATKPLANSEKYISQRSQCDCSMFCNISTKEKKTKIKLIPAIITTVSGQMYLLTKIHDVGGQEHVTAVHT